MKHNILLIAAIIQFFLIQRTFGQDINEIYSLIEKEEFEKAIDKAENLEENLNCEKIEIIGYCYRNIENYAKSIPYYEQYIKECTPDYVHRINLGDSYFKTNQVKKAKVQFLIAESEMPDLSLLKYNLGLLEYEEGNKKKAAEYFTLAINNDSGEVLDFDYLEMQIKTLIELKEYDAAFNNINTVLSFWDENQTGYKYSIVLKSSIYGAKGEYQKAISDLNIVIASGIQEQVVLIEAYSNLLEYYLKDRQNNKACDIYNKLKSLDPLNERLKEYKCK